MRMHMRHVRVVDGRSRVHACRFDEQVDSSSRIVDISVYRNYFLVFSSFQVNLSSFLSSKSSLYSAVF